MSKGAGIILGFIVVIGVVVTILAMQRAPSAMPAVSPMPTPVVTSTPKPTASPTSTVTPTPTKIDTNITLSLNQSSGPIAGTTLKVWAVTEDSRCPSDVRCIQAGRVKAALTVISPSGSSQFEMIPGQTVTTESLAITLVRVDPYPISTRKTPDDEYRFIFNVKSR